MKIKPIKKVDQVKQDLVRYRSQFDSQWKEHERAWYGDIWENNTKFKPTENHIFRIIENQVAVLTDGMPSARAYSLDPEFNAQANNMSKALDYVNRKQDLQQMLPIVVRNSHIGGPGYIHEYFDINANDGDGELKREVIHWEKVWLGKDKCRFEVQRSKEWLKMTYPKYAESIEDKSGDNMKGPEDKNDVLETRDIRGRAKRRKPQEYKDSDQLCLTFTYIKDFSKVKIDKEDTKEELMTEREKVAEMLPPDVKKTQDHDAHIGDHLAQRAELLAPLNLPGDTPFDQVEELIEQILAESPESGVEEILFRVKLLDNHIEEHSILKKENPNGETFKYPGNWRVIESIDDLVVRDGTNIYRHKRVPLSKFFCHKDGSLYHVNEVENIIDSQRMQVVMQYKEYKGLQRVANPNVIIDQETNLTEEDWTNEDGKVVVIPQGTNIRNMEPGMVSPQLRTFDEDRKRSMQEISGVNDVSEGKSPHPNAAQVTVEKLQLRSIGRQRIKIRSLKESIRELHEMTYSNILQFWTTEKVIGVDSSQEFDAQIIYNPLEMADLDFEIKIDDSSMAGVDKEAVNGLMYALLAQNRISLPQFLQITDIPKKDELLNLVQEDEQVAAQLEQVQMENIMLKGQFTPEQMTEEEAQVFEQLVQQSGVTEDQPVQPEGI